MSVGKLTTRQILQPEFHDRVCLGRDIAVTTAVNVRGGRAANWAQIQRGRINLCFVFTGGARRMMLPSRDARRSVRLASRLGASASPLSPIDGSTVFGAASIAKKELETSSAGIISRRGRPNADAIAAE